MSADSKYKEDAEFGLQSYCDKPLLTDSEIDIYCKEKLILIDSFEQ